MKEIKVKIVITAYGQLTDKNGNPKKVPLGNIVEDYDTVSIGDEQYDYLTQTWDAKMPAYQDIYFECLTYDFASLGEKLLAPRFDDIRHRLLDEGISDEEVDEKMSHLDGSVYWLRGAKVFFRETVNMFVKDGLFCRTLTDGTFSIVRCIDLDKTEVCSDAAYVENGAFKNCRHLQVVKLPNVKAVTPEAFSGCTRLTTVELSDNVETIGDEAFAHCYMLRTFRLPQSLEFIEESAFFHCCNLEALVYEEDGQLHRDTSRPKQLYRIRSNAFAFTPLDHLSDNDVYKALLTDGDVQDADADLVEARKVEMAKAVFDKLFNPDEWPFLTPFGLTRS